MRVTAVEATTPEPDRADAPHAHPPIRVAALALIRERRLLMVTARGREVVYLPGGKVDPGEAVADAVRREAREEVAVELDPASVRELFSFAVQAHGEPEGRLVHMTVFSGDTADEPVASAEVDAVHWIDSAEAHRCPPAGIETLSRLRALDLID